MKKPAHNLLTAFLLLWLTGLPAAVQTAVCRRS